MRNAQPPSPPQQPPPGAYGPPPGGMPPPPGGMPPPPGGMPPGAPTPYSPVEAVKYGWTGFTRNVAPFLVLTIVIDRKSTRLNSRHVSMSYAVFCLKNK